MNIYFRFSTNSGDQEGKLLVDDNSSLYGLSQGEKFTIQYDPAYPSKYYSEEASSTSKIIRRTIMVVGAVFAVTVFLIEFLGR